MRTEQTAFQQACIQRIEEVFSRHHLEAPSFMQGEGSSGWYWATFSLKGQEHRIEVYPDIVVMHRGESYFECYMDEEWKSEEALIEGFAIRLDRYLSGGSWAGPDEKGLPDLIKQKVEKVLRRFSGSAKDS
ncbi:MAG TPA: hypothetical protein VKK31_00395 [Thermoanaerobaculia bacterium]|nr:hypothetical protein [Thermoanaerobaculia bacterium]